MADLTGIQAALTEIASGMQALSQRMTLVETTVQSSVSGRGSGAQPPATSTGLQEHAAQPHQPHPSHIGTRLGQEDVAVDEDMEQRTEEDEAQDAGQDDDDLKWDDVLAQNKIQCKTREGGLLCKLVSSPPPLGQLKESTTKLPKYQQVPQKPPPRRHKGDMAMYQAQKKMEEAINMSIHMVETQDNSHITVQTALMRSAWEDLQQSRRHLLAGRQSNKLDPRTDDN